MDFSNDILNDNNENAFSETEDFPFTDDNDLGDDCTPFTPQTEDAVPDSTGETKENDETKKVDESDFDEMFDLSNFDTSNDTTDVEEDVFETETFDNVDKTAEENNFNETFNTENSDNTELRELPENVESIDNTQDAQDIQDIQDESDKGLQSASTKPDFSDTAKLFGVSEEKLTAEFNAYKAAKLFKRINLLAVSPKLTIKEMQGAIKSAIDLGLESVTVLPSKAATAKKTAADKIQIRVACCYPFGAETFAVKLKSVKAAAKIKPSAIEIPFELADLAQKKPEQIIKEWRKLIKAAGRASVIMVGDIDLLSAHEITSICDLARGLQVKLKTSTCVLSSGDYDFQSSTLSAFNGVKLEMSKKAPTSEETLSMFVSGADTVSSMNALDSVKGIKRLLGCE